MCSRSFHVNHVQRKLELVSGEAKTINKPPFSVCTHLLTHQENNTILLFNNRL
jgi:hypothetical protein